MKSVIMGWKNRKQQQGNLYNSMMKKCALFVLVFSLLPLVMPAEAAQRRTQAARKQAAQKNAVYVCEMDPEIRSSKPGKCPKCGMILKKASDEPDTAAGPSDEAKSSGDLVKPLQIPDTTVYDQNGKKLRFYSDLVKGKTVAINFIFTTCTTVCPPLTATFRKVQQTAAERGLDVKLVSISVDPVVDTPERLRAFAEKFKVDQGWTFVTGDKGEIDSLLASLGASVANKNDHTPMILIGNDTVNYWTRAYGLSPPSRLVELITDAAGRK